MFHYVLVVDHDDKGSDATEVRLEGRKFMLSVTLFMVILGFQSLAFSRLEGWSYSDAICERSSPFEWVESALSDERRLFHSNCFDHWLW